MANKISCQVGRTKIIDPNAFDGQSSSNNIPVALEDLNISVALTTSKKGRTLLTATEKDGVIESSRDLTINFLDGSEINGTRVLTTNYTNFTTVFDDNSKASSSSSESLGITSIDIDFNSQIAPMIVINFVDVKGSAIFQNEKNLKEGVNKYSTFFQMPYPLFELTIKGYYGKPVTYCLHLTKFNSRFNSKTGNFEITCNFIGYTYAMLSDMLIGYLKAIPKTTVGKTIYGKINEQRKKLGLGEILTLNDLMLKISNINTEIDKAAAVDDDSFEIRQIDEQREILNRIENIVSVFANGVDSRPSEVKDALTQFDYVIKTRQDVKNVDTLISNYKSSVNEEVRKFNEKTEVVLNENLFNLYWSFLNRNKQILTQEKNSSGIDNSRASSILKYLESNTSFVLNDTSFFDVWDLTDVYIDINKAKATLDENYKRAKESLAIKIKARIKDTIGFDSTVRNILEIMTTAVEVFMEAIYTVSKNAQDDVDGKRAKQLLKKFNTNENSDLTDRTQIFPWPDYREQQGSEGYVEKYLGEYGVLDRPMDVEELEFIDDLLKAFIKSQQETENVEDIITNIQTSWFPVNPADTTLFGVTESPYKRIGLNGLSGYDKIANLMLIRGMTFLAHSNTFLSKPEIENMAEVEASAMLDDIKDEKLKQGLALIDLDYMTKLTANIDMNNGINPPINRKIVTLGNNGNMYYTMFTADNFDKGVSVLPIDEGFEGNWNFTETEPFTFEGSADGESVFLTNYNNKVEAATDFDGGIYVKIFSKETFETNINSNFPTKPESLNTTPTKLVLSKLKEENITGSLVRDYGFNAFGGSYGIQEFVNMDFGEYDGLSLVNVFFKKSDEDGMGFSRRLTPNSSTNYDFGVSKQGDKYVRNSSKTVFYVNHLYTESWHPKNTITENALKNIGENWANLFVGEKPTITYPFVDSDYRVNSAGTNYKFSLFGSRWYYGQSLSKYPIYSKALLFLSTIPWNGMPFEKNEIRRLFSIRAGFIHVPKLWAAYVGGVLWRMDTTAPEIDSLGNIVGGGSGPVDPIVFKKSVNDILTPNRTPDNSDGFVPPSRKQSLHSLRSDITISDVYDDLPKVLSTLPKQVRDEFKYQFFNFVKNGSAPISQSNDDSLDFQIIDEKSRLVNGDINEFDSKLDILYTAIGNVSTNASTNFYVDKHFISDNFVNIENYQWIIPLSNDVDTRRQINLMYAGVGSDSTKPMGVIVDMLIKEVIIGNTNYHIWGETPNTYDLYYPVFCSDDNFNTYFNKVINTIKAKVTTTNTLEEKKRIEQEIFGTVDENLIKLQLYKTCKNTFDKWLGGVNNPDNIIFQCGQKKRNNLDTELANKYRKGDTPRLIDSFRFVDRAFSDIGDKFYINPEPLNDFLMNSPNSSFYDVVGSLLTSNNFNFIALPTYINYNDPKELESMFQPYGNYELAVSAGTCGPTFVCVYVGQTSKHLDFGDSNYPNDGVSFDCNNLNKIPDDFANTANSYENDVAVFAVNYGQQNQNIFKDVTLDQNEFSETAESLQVTNDIANKGGENNASLAGQNIFNVYSVRSYKAEVEMMGNAMIQPMMHFQLNNIPMFHGGYLITRVKHAIQPNHMSTNFTGVRIRYPKTKLMEGIDFFMNIIDSIDFSTATSETGNGTDKNYIFTYRNDLVANIAPLSVIETGIYTNKVKLTQTAEAEIRSWGGGTVNESNGINMLTKYANTTRGVSAIEYSNGSQPWSAAFVSYLMVSGDANFPKSTRHYDYVTAAMDGKMGYEAFPLKNRLKIKAEVGDLFCTARSGGYTNSHCDVLYKVNGNVAHLVGGNLSDTVKTKTINLTDGYIVKETALDYEILIKKTNNKYFKNKKLKGTSGYEDTNAKIETGNNADYWALVAICSLENFTNQGRADVAQSIYNRLLSKKYGKSSIKELIVDGDGVQYEPVRRAKAEFRAINSKETAIKAHQKANKVPYENAKLEIEKTEKALNDVNLVTNAKTVIGGRTDFYSSTIKERIPKNGIGLVNRDNQIFGWFVGAGAIAYGKTNPPAANKPDFSRTA